MLREAHCTREEADAIYKLTALCTYEERFVIPPMNREQAIEMMKEPHEHRAETGFGFVGGQTKGI
jgi:nitrate reductase beta subunit